MPITQAFYNLDHREGTSSNATLEAKKASYLQNSGLPRLPDLLTQALDTPLTRHP